MKPFWITLIAIFTIALLVVIFLAWVGYRIKKAQKEGKAEGIRKGNEILANAKANAESKPKKRKASSGGTYKKKPRK